MLKGHKVLHEEPTHFVVEKPDGTAMKVAKAKLAHSTVEKIRGYAAGGEVAPANMDQAPTAAPDPATAASPDPAIMDPSGQFIDPAPNIMPSGKPPLADRVASLYASSVAPPPAAAPAPPSPFAPPAPADAMVQMPRGAPYVPAKVPADFAKGEAEQRAGIEAGAKAKGAEAQGALAVQEEATQRRAALAGDFERRMGEHAARSEQLFNDVASSKIDPNHYWGSKSTGQKVSASIGLILGGIGAGLSRGPNLAAQTIDQAIDRDMEAQRADLGKKQSLLSHYMQQGREMQTAYGLAKADALDMTAGALMANALKFGDPKAQAEAQIQSGILRQQGATLRQGAEQHALALQAQKAQGAWQSQLAGALNQGMGGGASGVASSPARVALFSSFMGKPEAWAAHQIRIPEEKQIGTSKDGTPRYKTEIKTDIASTPEDAKKANDALLSNREQGEKLRRIELFVKQHGAGAWSPAEKQRIESLVNDFKLSWNQSQEGLKRVNELEMGAVTDMIGNPGGFWSNVSGKTDAAVSVLRSAVNSRKVGIVDTFRAQ